METKTIKVWVALSVGNSTVRSNVSFVSPELALKTAQQNHYGKDNLRSVHEIEIEVPIDFVPVKPGPIKRTKSTLPDPDLTSALASLLKLS